MSHTSLFLGMSASWEHDWFEIQKSVSYLHSDLKAQRQGCSQKGVQASRGRPLFGEIQGKFT